MGSSGRKWSRAIIGIFMGLPMTICFAANDMSDMAMPVMDDNPLVFKVMADELEWQNSPTDATLAWDASAWWGRDDGRLLIRSEGEWRHDRIESVRAEVLWSKPIAPWWSVVGGVRQDAGEGSGRSYGLIGIEGLAPYWFHVQADLFGGERGQLGARIETEYDLRLTNRLFLKPSAELSAYSKSDAATGIGSGLSSLDVGLRLRYEIRREFAPYVGLEWHSAYGDTADLARELDEPVRDALWVAGVQLWF